MKKVSITGWIFAALVAGMAFGLLLPGPAQKLAVLGDIFLRMIASILAPLMFSALVVGVARSGDARSMGRIGGKALVLFQVLTTVAILIGVGAALLIQPGVGITQAADVSAVPQNATSLNQILVSPFPTSIFDAMARGDVLQIVVFAVLFGFSCAAVGEKAAVVIGFLESLAEIMYRYTHYVMFLAPLGIFGAVAASVGSKGPDVLFSLGKLIVAVYAGLILFVLLVLLPLAKFARVPIGRFLTLVREPFLIAFSTTSSNVALPQALQNMEALGVPRHIAALVLPSSMSFNTTGSCLFLGLASVFGAQAVGITLSMGTLVLMVLTLMLTTKGIGAVPRGSLVILAGTLTSFGLPLEGVALILGVDQLMDMARTSVNMLGHCLATAVVARWEGAELRA